MSPEPFQIALSDALLDDLKRRLAHTRWPQPLPNAGWERGAELDYLRSVASYWQDGFDWRAQEAALNRHAQFRCVIDGIDIHFVHERGRGPDPLPIILTHGWPDSFIRYHKIIPLLTDPSRHGGKAEDAFDVVAPSVPGFGFSGYPQQGGMNNAQTAELWARLMTDVLGYPRFVAGGGDIGSGVTRYLALAHPVLLHGIHLTDLGLIRPLINAANDVGLSSDEQRYKAQALEWLSGEGAYLSLQATKPQTLSFGLSDSPLGLAAWILEKFRSWSDCGGNLATRFSLDELLSNIMLYWAGNSSASSASVYYDNMHSLPPMGHIDVPTAVALFPADILPPPKDWALRNLNISRWTHMPRGGHFTAMEEPECLAEDIRAFCRAFR